MERYAQLEHLKSPLSLKNMYTKVVPSVVLGVVPGVVHRLQLLVSCSRLSSSISEDNIQRCQ